MKKISLFSKGCLGTCWYGKYHYMEPWAGCSNDCFYCYARFRKNVSLSLKEKRTSFEKPVPLFEPGLLLKKIKRETFSGRIKILKLCRFTDIFAQEFVENGLTAEILSILAASKVERIIITTKGLPSPEIEGIIAAYPAKFSYNFAIRPRNNLRLEAAAPPLEERIYAASRIASYGVRTTAHLDPFAAGFDDGACLERLLAKLSKAKVKRAMFSYLLLSPEIIDCLERRSGPALTKRLVALYDTGVSRKYLPGQQDTIYFSLKPEAKKISVSKTAAALEKAGFDFVLCSLKSGAGAVACGVKRERLCDGTFYA